MLFSLEGFGQLVTFDFPATNSLVPTSMATNCNATNMQVSAGSISTNQTTTTNFPNKPYILSNTGWAATTPNSAKNFHFTITANPGYEIEITNISYRASSSPAGPSAFGFAINTINLYETNAPNGTIVHINEPITGQTGLTTATIKIQGWNNGSRTTTGGGEFRLDDVVISGIATPVTNYPEPTNHPTDFTCTTIGDSEITLNWTDANGGQEPGGYLIRWSNSDFSSIPDPVDGNYISNGSNTANVPSGTETTTIGGLNSSTAYFFKIFPYTNSGSTVDYKTDGSVPQTSCTTFIGPCGFETFDNFNPSPPTSYTDGTFVGNNGIIWHYVKSRTHDAYPINGKGIMLQQLSGESKVFSSTVPGGLGNFSCKMRKGFTGAGDRQVELFVNGVSIATSIAWDNDDIQTFSVPGINIAGDVVVEIRNFQNEQVVIDDIKWSCYDGCTPTQTIANFNPISGPAETTVTIQGTGFTDATSVRFAGEPASFFQPIDDNTIIATVSQDAITGKITITVDGCDRTSADSFTILRDNNKCGMGGSGGPFASDLFISEVYDAAIGSLSYIEVFNGTQNPVIFSSTPYTIRIKTGATNIFNYPMNGTLASGDTYILRIGSNINSECEGFTINDDKPLAPGFNGNDFIYLLNNGDIIDDVPNPNTGPGFGQSRKHTVTGPKVPYDANEWIISETENCENLSIPPYIPNASNITISQHPQNPECNAVSFNVVATADPGFTNSNPYVWRYNAPGEPDWKLVSEFNTGTEGISVNGSGTHTITLTGNTAILLDYQFYVELATSGSPQCKVSSNATKYNYGFKPFYRTKGNGNWSDKNTWEMSDSETGTFESACQYPIDRNSDHIVIQNGNAVNLDVKIPVNRIKIEGGGQLSLNQGGALTLHNGNPSGSDLIINGTLIDNVSSGKGISFLPNATWEIASGANLIKTNTSSVVTYRDNYENEIENIPEDANWIYRRLGNNDISIATVGMVYPNLAFENHVPGLYAPVSTNYNFSGLNNTLIIKGNLDIGINGIGTYAVRTNNTNSAPIKIHKNLNIGAGSSLNNISTGSDFGTGFEVLGDLNILGTLDLTNGTGTNRGLLKLSGNQNTFGTGTSTVNVNHFSIEKEAGTSLSADLSFNIHKSATFTSGILKLENSSNIFEIQPSATLSGASNTSFVNGRVRKHKNTSQDFTFPIGDSNSDGDFYQPARVFGNATPTVIDAQYFIEPHPHAGNDPQVGHCDYWRVEKVSGDDVKLALKYTNENPLYCNQIGDPESVIIASLNAANEWDLTDSEAEETTQEIEMKVYIESPVTGGWYGDFVFHTLKPNLNVLPVELLSITATPKDKKVIVHWITSTEKNNNFFSVERSRDAANFYKIGVVQGAGDSHTETKYKFVDNQPLSGISYYRLRQTDFDGSYTHSPIRAVQISDLGNFEIENVWRNGNELNMIYNTDAHSITVEIFNVLGKRIFAETVANYGGHSVIYPNLSRGVYVVRISQDHLSDSQKIIW